MKTTIDIPDEMLKEAMANSKASSKRDAVLTALEEYNRRKRAEKVVATFGTFKNMMTQKELRALRESRAKHLEAQWRGRRGRRSNGSR